MWNDQQEEVLISLCNELNIFINFKQETSDLEGRAKDEID